MDFFQIFPNVTEISLFFIGQLTPNFPISTKKVQVEDCQDLSLQHLSTAKNLQQLVLCSTGCTGLEAISFLQNLRYLRRNFLVFVHVAVDRMYNSLENIEFLPLSLQHLELLHCDIQDLTCKSLD